MIDAVDLGRVVHEEARSHAIGITYSDAPALDPEARFARALNDRPLPTPDQVSLVLEEVFWASLLAEEERPCRPRLLYLRHTKESRPVHWFEEPLPLDRHALRKIAPAHGPLGYITWESVEGRPFLTGIEPRQGGDPSDFIVEVRGPGEIDINWACFRMLRLREGELIRFSTCCLPPLEAVTGWLAGLLGTFEPKFLGRVVRAIEQQGHGGSLWVVKDRSVLSGVTIGNAVRPDDRPLLERFPTFAARLPWLVSIGRLAAVDGAVLIDSKVQVLGFAAFVQLSEPGLVVRRFADGRSETVSETDLGGGRHRAAVAFCRRCAPAAAVVVSQDGRVMAIAASGRESLPWCAELGAFGLTDFL